MVELGQYLPLRFEAAGLAGIVCGDQFQCGSLLILPVCAFGPIDLAHAATAEQLPDLPGADAATEACGRSGVRCLVWHRAEPRLKKVPGLLFGGQQLQHTSCQLGISGAFTANKILALIRRAIQGGIQHGLNGLPTGGIVQTRVP